MVDKPILTQELLRSLLTYHKHTGVFKWIKIPHFSPGGYNFSYKKANCVAGVIDSITGYRRISLYGKKYNAHRLAFLYVDGYLPENGVDHINRDRCDNRWDNLREVSSSCNQKNKTIQNNNTSGVTGVCWHNGISRWCVVIVDKKQKHKHVGSFSKFDDAVMARWLAEKDNDYMSCNTVSTAYNYLRDNCLLREGI